MLLDVRTGLVPFVATATRNYDLERSDEDLTFRETVLKAQLGAVAAALGDVSSAVTRFLEGATAASARSAKTPAGSGAAVSAPADFVAAPVTLTRSDGAPDSPLHRAIKRRLPWPISIPP